MNNHGFTLIEMMIGLLLVSVIGFGVTEASLTARKVWEREAVVLQLQQQARLAIDAMSSELRAARNLTFENETSLVFSTPNLTGVSYYLNSSANQIVREYPSGTKKVLANRAVFLNLSSDGSEATIQLRMAKDYRGTTVYFPASGNLTEVVNLRNE